MAGEANETERAPKKGGRKPDPMTKIVADMKAVGKDLGDYTTTDAYAFRRKQHDTRAAAWGREYAKTGAFDAMLLSLTFEALAGLNPAERRYALLQLSAAALNEVMKLDGGE
ncbi:hypothetical protein AB0E27_31640 [Streptomyces sparsogenes]|uniref:hypothetical protein n=1 Tax=Streptomyces sparsogenes TaxID=67365 RepID=UPI0033C3321B